MTTWGWPPHLNGSAHIGNERRFAESVCQALPTILSQDIITRGSPVSNRVARVMSGATNLITRVITRRSRRKRDTESLGKNGRIWGRQVAGSGVSVSRGAREPRDGQSRKLLQSFALKRERPGRRASALVVNPRVSNCSKPRSQMVRNEPSSSALYRPGRDTRRVAIGTASRNVMVWIGEQLHYSSCAEVGRGI